MTAVNVLIMPDAAHVFTDGGHYIEPGMHLAAIGQKVFPLPRWSAAIAVCGPSHCGPALVAEMERIEANREGMLAAFPGAVAWATRGIDVPWTAILVGHDGAPFGLALEEGGRAHPLGPGSVVRSLACSTQFDPDDVAGSGLAMMEDQRSRHGVATGFCQYTVIRRDRINSRVLRRWPDRIERRSAETVASKIGVLEVKRINIANGAVTGSDVASESDVSQGSVDVTAANESERPTTLFVAAIGVADHSASVHDTSFFVTLTRLRDGATIYTEAQAVSGTSGGSVIFSRAVIDFDAQDDEDYRLECTYELGGQPPPDPPTYTSIELRVLWDKR